MGKIFHAWARLATQDKAGEHQREESASRLLLLQQRDLLAAELREARAAFEAERRSLETAQIDARLQGRGRVAELEHELRRIELDAQERLMAMQLHCDEKAMAEARAHELEMVELQNALRMEQISRDAEATNLRGKIAEVRDGWSCGCDSGGCNG